MHARLNALMLVLVCAPHALQQSTSPVCTSLCDSCVLVAMEPAHVCLSIMRFPLAAEVRARQFTHCQPPLLSDIRSWPFSDADVQVLTSPSARRRRTASGQCWKHHAAATPRCAIHLLDSSRPCAASSLTAPLLFALLLCAPLGLPVGCIIPNPAQDWVVH